MKDSVLTIRLPATTRRRIEQFAHRESRSLSQAAERLLELGLAQVKSGAMLAGESDAPSPATEGLAGCFSGGLVPTLADFRAARSELSESMLKRAEKLERRRR